MRNLKVILLMKRAKAELQSILSIRWKQCYRILFCIDAVHLILLFCLVGFIGISCFYILGREVQNLYVLAIMALLLFILHYQRQDRRFLHINVEYKNLIICCEYIILTLPIVTFLAIHKFWLYSIGMLTISILLGLVPMIKKKHQKKTLNTLIQRKIPDNAYEWKAGVRRYFWYLLASWIVGLSTCFYFYSSVIATLLIGLSVLDFFRLNESRQMLLSCQQGPSKFLQNKILQSILLLSLLILPQLILTIIFRLNLWYIPVIEYVILLSILIYVITLKYAFYSPQRTSVSIIRANMGVLIGLNPMTTIVLWILSILLYRKACLNLKIYLNDYD